MEESLKTKQEWTDQTVREICDSANIHVQFKAVAVAHNAELTAERQRSEQAEAEYIDEVRAAHVQAKEIMQLRQQLLSALAAIEKHNAYYKHWSPHEIKGQIHPTTIEVDLSLLHEHVKKEQKPLRDALENIATQTLSPACAEVAADALAKVTQ